MNISAARLSKALALTKKAISSRNYMPALSCVKVGITETGGLSVIGNDCDTYIMICDEEAANLPPATQYAYDLTSLINAVKGAGKNATITADDSSISCDGFRANVTSEPLENLPEAPEMGALEFKVSFNNYGYRYESFLESLSVAETAINNEESRFTLNAALIDPEPNDLYAIAATDSHRLVVRREKGFVLTGEPKPFMVSKHLCHCIQAIAGKRFNSEIQFDVYADFVRVQFNTDGFLVCLIQKKVVGTFPDWRRVFPKSSGIGIVVNQQSLHLALERIKSATGKPSVRHRAAVRIEVGTDDTITLTAGSLGEMATATMKAEPTSAVIYKKFTFALSWLYLSEACGCYANDKNVTIMVNVQNDTVNSPVVINGEYVIMPMRIE